MRKFTLLLAMLAVTSMTFAQSAYKAKDNVAKAKQFKQAATKANTPFWTEDFNSDDWSSTVDQGTTGGYLSNGTELPNSWVAVDLTENDYLWHWSDVGPRGRWTSGDANDLPGSLIPDESYLDADLWPVGNTISNGFMMLECDFYNTNELGEMVSDPLDMSTTLTVGPIDCSGKNGVLATFNTMYRFCCASDHKFNLSVSADYDPANPTSAHWTVHQVNLLTETNNTTHIDERHVEVNISNTATDQSAVYLRFNTTGLSHYYAIIDDLSLTEAAVNDIKINMAWAEYMYVIEAGDHFWGGYSELPVDAVSDFKVFEAAVLNNGSGNITNAAITTKLFHDDELLETLTSPAKNIGPFANDTLTISTSFTPADLGTYQVSMTAHADGTDENPANNGWEYEFKTTANTYSRVRHGSENQYGRASAGDWVGGGYDGDMLLAEYVTDEGTNVVFSGLNVYIWPTTDEAELAAIAKGQFQMKAVGFEAVEDIDDPVDLNIYSELYTIKSSDLGTWVYLPYIDEGSLLQGPGDYYVGIETYTGTAAELDFNIGSDDLRGIRQPDYVNYNFQTSGETAGFGWVTANFAIDLMINMPDMVTATIVYDMSGVTVNDGDVIKVKGSLGDKDELTLTYDSGTSTATGSLTVPKNTTITFKAYLNDVAETVSEDYSVTLVSTKTLNYIFGGVTVESDALQFAKLYPNPFNETLTIENLIDVKEINVSNILGQQVMSISDVEDKVTISASDLNNGVYIISIIDNNNNVRTEKMMKK